MPEWKVVCEPHGENPGMLDKAKDAVGITPSPENIGGVIIYVTDGAGRKEEVSRVAWIRRASVNPKTGFAKQLQTEVTKAKEATDILNGLLSPSGDPQ